MKINLIIISLFFVVLQTLALSELSVEELEKLPFEKKLSLIVEEVPAIEGVGQGILLPLEHGEVAESLLYAWAKLLTPNNDNNIKKLTEMIDSNSDHLRYIAIRSLAFHHKIQRRDLRLKDLSFAYAFHSVKTKEFRRLADFMRSLKEKPFNRTNK